MDLARDVIQSRLGRAIRGVGEICVLHVPDNTSRTADGYEFGSFGSIEEWEGCLKEAHNAKHVDGKVLDHVFWFD